MLRRGEAARSIVYGNWRLQSPATIYAIHGVRPARSSRHAQGRKLSGESLFLLVLGGCRAVPGRSFLPCLYEHAASKSCLETAKAKFFALAPLWGPEERLLFPQRCPRACGRGAGAMDGENSPRDVPPEVLEANLIAPTVVPGDRVACFPGDRMACVMFVGQMPNMPAGYWVGVQYDEKVGKNDGMLNGKRYFTCPPGHGGFLRASKVTPKEDFQSKMAELKLAEAAQAAKKNAQRADSTKRRPGGKVSLMEEPDEEPGHELTEEEQKERSARYTLERRNSIAAWEMERMNSGRGPLSGRIRSARKTPREREKGTTHPYRIQTSGSGLSSAVVGSLAQFTLTAYDEEGNRRNVGGDNFNVTMRGNGGSQSSQPALVRTKLTDRGDGSYMCEYRPWMTGAYSIHITLDEDPIKGSPFILNVITLRPDAAQCVVRGDALYKAVARIPQKFDVLFVDAIGHVAHAEELDVFVEPWVGPPSESRRERRPSQIQPDGESIGDDGSQQQPAATTANGGKARPVAEMAPPEDQHASADGAAADSRDASPASLRGLEQQQQQQQQPLGSARVRKLDAPTRQRHLSLWQTRLAADKWLVRRQAEEKFRESGYGDEGKKKKKSQGDSTLPSFTHELSADKYGFAFGGVDPGTLHAHGKLIKVHHVSYSIGLAGRYKLHVALRQQMKNLPGSPFELEVEPGTAYAASTKLPENVHLTGHADEEWQHGLVLRTADMLGNLCVKGGADLTMSLPKRWIVEHELTDSPVNCRVTDNKDGTYELDWQATLAGNFPLDVCVDGSHIAGSPITVTVLPARPDVNRFVASGAGLAKATAGIEAPIRIRVADRFDNTADVGSAQAEFGLTLVSQAGQGVGGSKLAGGGKKVEAEGAPGKKGAAKGDEGKAAVPGTTSKGPLGKARKEDATETMPFTGAWVNGCYEIRYVAQQAGVLDLNLWCIVDQETGTKEPLPGSPFAVHVSEGTASPVGSFVREAEASKQGAGIVAGEHVILKPQLNDMFGNPSSAPEGVLTAVLDSPAETGQVLEPPKLRSGLGSYELTLEPFKAGPHHVHILLEGKEITGSPVNFYVSPAAPNSQKCYLYRPDSEPILINSQCDILLKTHDKYGNQLDRGGVRVDAKAAGVAASACTVEDHKDGTYTIRLTAGAPGEVKVTARIDSVELKPLSVFFTKTAADGEPSGKEEEAGEEGEILAEELMAAAELESGESAGEKGATAAAAKSGDQKKAVEKKKDAKSSPKGTEAASASAATLADAPVEPGVVADASSSTTAAGSSAEPTGGAEAGKPAKGKAGKSGKPPAAAKGVAGTATAPAADTSDAKATKKAGAGSKGKSARKGTKTEGAPSPAPST